MKSHIEHCMPKLWKHTTFQKSTMEVHHGKLPPLIITNQKIGQNVTVASTKTFVSIKGKRKGSKETGMQGNKAVSSLVQTSWLAKRSVMSSYNRHYQSINQSRDPGKRAAATHVARWHDGLWESALLKPPG